MRPPKPFNWKKSDKHYMSFSMCIACGKWKWKTNIFYHEGKQWNLCFNDFGDYWENTEELMSDFVWYS